MDLSLRGIVRSRYGLASGFSVINDVLGRAKNDIGEDYYRTVTGSVSVRFLLTTLVGTLTQHHNNRRTGGYLNEVVLATSNVKQQFGKLFTRSVDGQIYAQPLYLPNVNIPGQGIHNVVYVATMHNTIYAFDADDPNASMPLWMRQLEPSIHLPDSNIGGGSDYTDIHQEVGIVSTPVISLRHNALYVVVATKNALSYGHILHSLDLTTGQVMGIKAIIATVPGTGDGSVNGTITFTSNRQLQRPALLLANDAVYVAFAGYADVRPYHGWVFAYDPVTLQQLAVFNTTPQSTRGGIWHSGHGLASDSDGNLYFITGNSYSTEAGDPDYRDDPPNASALHDSLVRLHPDLTLADWFSPHDSVELSKDDVDLGAGGVLLLPDTALALGGGKGGKFYLVNTQNMGKFDPNDVDDSRIVQPPFNVGQDDILFKHEIHSIVYWSGPNGPSVYVWPGNLDGTDVMRAFKLVNGQFQTTPAAQSTIDSPWPGGILSISANGNQAGTGIVWASCPYNQRAFQQDVEGILHAFDATDLTTELWNSKQNPNRDDIGLFAKFCPPTIANGKVYMATFSGDLAVYGLL